MLLGLCLSTEAETPYLAKPLQLRSLLSEFALVYFHLLASKDVTLSQATPFGREECLERDSAVSHPLPIVQAAGRMNASVQKVGSEQHITAYTINKLF